MPRGKRTVYGGYCPDCGSRIGSFRFHRQNSKGVAWKDNHPMRFCTDCRANVAVKLKEEKHSS